MNETTKDVADLLIHTILGVSKQFRCLFRHEQHAQLAPGHFRILTYLIHHQPNLQELADKAMVTPATMSKTVELLQEHGWVSRTQNPEDRRQVVIRLTDKGQSLLQNMHQDVIEQISEKLSVLSQDDMVVLDQGLRVLKKMFFDTETDRNDHRSIA